jgi:hypothetical protein
MWRLIMNITKSPNQPIKVGIIETVHARAVTAIERKQASALAGVEGNTTNQTQGWGKPPQDVCPTKAFSQKCGHLLLKGIKPMIGDHASGYIHFCTKPIGTSMMEVPLVKSIVPRVGEVVSMKTDGRLNIPIFVVDDVQFHYTKGSDTNEATLDSVTVILERG